MIVRARVVHAIDGQNWTNGLCGTGRGVGRPIRPPTVCTKRADEPSTSGSGLDVGQLDRGEAQRGRPDLHGRRADVALAEMPGVHDPAVLDLDERAQLVRLAEAVARSELLEIDEAIGRRFVVVGDADLERDLRRPGDGLRRDP